MVKSLEFAKLSGSGNDFLCVDNRDGRYDELIKDPRRIRHFARTICHRGTGIGADGIIFAGRPEVEAVADVAASLFEPDGSEAELCGNGTACFIRWVTTEGWIPDREIKVLTPAGVVLGKNVDFPYVRVCIPLPEGIRTGQRLEARGKTWEYDFVISGVPHAVVYVEDVCEVDIAHWGPALRHHKDFQPRGVNANFVQVLGEGRLALRTWEFGVEGETLACGTGSASAAILAARRFGWGEDYRRGRKPVEVQASSGDKLRVYFTEEADGSVSDVCLETVVRFLFCGRAHRHLLDTAWNHWPQD